MTKTAIERKPRTYANDREYRRRRAEYRAKAFSRKTTSRRSGSGSQKGGRIKYKYKSLGQQYDAEFKGRIGNPRESYEYEHLEYPQSWLKKMGLSYVLDGGEVLQETTYDKIKKVQKDWNYKGKPSPKGEPDNPPPELDPKTNQHPQHGQHAARYKKLDPQSAESMPPTGDQDIDSAVQKQVDKKKKARKIKNLVGKN